MSRRARSRCRSSGLAVNGECRPAERAAKLVGLHTIALDMRKRVLRSHGSVLQDRTGNLSVFAGTRLHLCCEAISTASPAWQGDGATRATKLAHSPVSQQKRREAPARCGSSPRSPGPSAPPPRARPCAAFRVPAGSRSCSGECITSV